MGPESVIAPWRWWCIFAADSCALLALVLIAVDFVRTEFKKKKRR